VSCSTSRVLVHGRKTESSTNDNGGAAPLIQDRRLVKRTSSAVVFWFSGTYGSMFGSCREGDPIPKNPNGREPEFSEDDIQREELGPRGVPWNPDPAQMITQPEKKMPKAVDPWAHGVIEPEVDDSQKEFAHHTVVEASGT
jgi:hypothetical protein